MLTRNNAIVCGAVAGAMAWTGAASADVIASEDFDGGAVNLSSTTNVFFYGAGGGTGGDAFGVMSQFNGGAGTGGPFDIWDDSVIDTSGGGMFPGDSRGIAGQNTTAFFGMVDSDGNIDGSGGNVNNAVWNFDISSAVSIDNIMIDIAAMGDFESSSMDGFLIEAQIDGGGWVNIFQGITDEDATHTYRPMDAGGAFTESDPLELFIDGVATGTFLDKADPTTGNFDTFTSVALAGQSGSSLEIRISWAGSPSGGEAMGFDNFVINGSIPAPGALALLGIAALAGTQRRRK